MNPYILALAKEFVKGTPSKTPIKPADSTTLLEEKLGGSLKDKLTKLKRITGSLSHDSSPFSQLSYLQSYFTKNKDFDSKFKAFVEGRVPQSASFQADKKTTELLLELVLFIKYERENPGTYALKINEYISTFVDKLGLDLFRALIQELAGSEAHSFFNIIEDYCELSAIAIARNRYLYSGFIAGRKDGYVDRLDGYHMLVVNPETMEQEDFVAKNIQAIKEETKQQEMSLLGKIYTPAAKSNNPVIFVTWRGTQTKESALSDAQISAGFESYLKFEVDILRQISESIDAVFAANDGKPVTVIFSGHSLGGALSQYTYNSVQGSLCRGDGQSKLSADYYDELSKELHESYKEMLPGLSAKINTVAISPQKVSNMHAVLFSSPGVLFSVNNSSLKYSKHLTSLATPVGQHAHFSLTHADPVPCAGKSSILVPPTDSGALVELMFFETAVPGLAMKVAGLGAAVFAGGVAGTAACPGPGTVAGMIVGATGFSGCVAVGAKKAHTKDYYDEHGTIKTKIKEPDLVAAKHYSSKVISEVVEIVAKLGKAYIMNAAMPLVSSFDLLGHRTGTKAVAIGLEQKIEPNKSSSEQGASTEAGAVAVVPPVAMNQQMENPFGFFLHPEVMHDGPRKIKGISPLDFVVTPGM